MEINITNVIIVSLAFITVILILKFIVKKLFKIIGFFIVVAALFAYLYTTGVISYNKDNKIMKKVKETVKMDISLSDLKTKYCSGNLSKDDKIKCECIIEPLYKDLTSRFSNKELDDLKDNKLKLLRVFTETINRNKDEIKKRLKEKDASYLWDDFMSEIKSGKILDKLKNAG